MGSSAASRADAEMPEEPTTDPARPTAALRALDPPAPSAVGPLNRNGYASALGRLIERIVALGPRRRARLKVSLSQADEAALRSGDASQLGPEGLALAMSRDDVEWRSFLARHLRQRYDLLLVALDVTETGVE